MTPSRGAPPSYAAQSAYGSDERPTDGSQSGATMRLLTSVEDNVRHPLVFPIKLFFPHPVYVVENWGQKKCIRKHDVKLATLK